MKDEEIVSLYWERNELALAETERKYGRYLMQLAYNILASREDGEESVSETYWRAWNSMPPRRPELLRAYLAKIARRVSIDRFRARHSRKRESSEYQLSLEELGDCLPGGGETEEAAELHRLTEALERFLRALPAQARRAFVGRYFFADPVRDVASYCGMSEGGVRSLLFRTRRALRDFLEKEGFSV